MAHASYSPRSGRVARYYPYIPRAGGGAGPVSRTAHTPQGGVIFNDIALPDHVYMVLAGKGLTLTHAGCGT